MRHGGRMKLGAAGLLVAGMVLAWTPRLLGGGLCVLLAVLVNRNELWIARQVGVPVRLWHLPRLVRTTQAPFKRRVFGLLARLLSGRWEIAAEAPTP